MKISAIAFSIGAIACAVASAKPPVAENRPVTDTYHGVKVTDPFQWLENWDDPAVQAWSAAQNEFARAYLDALPGVDQIRKRVTEIFKAETESYSDVHVAAGHVFAIKRQPPKQQPFLIVTESVDNAGSARILVDPNKIDPTGGTAIDWYVPSPNGGLVAVSLSKGGTESGDVHIFDTFTGEQTFGVVPRVNGGTAGGSLAWKKDSSGFFYTRYPRGDERKPEDMDFYTQVFFHDLKQDTAKDTFEIGSDFPRINEIQFETSESSDRLLAVVQYGDGGKFAVYLRELEGQWKQIADYDDRIIHAFFGPNDDVFLVSRRNAPKGEIVRLPVLNPVLTAATTVIPECEDSIVTDFMGPSTMLAHAGHLWVTYQTGGPSEVRVFDMTGKPVKAPKQPAVGAVEGLAAYGPGEILYLAESFIEPAAWYVANPVTGATKRTSLETTSPVKFDDVEVVREFATSKDGTKVPVNIIKPKGVKLDGTNPVVLNGYGGYGVNITPAFRASRKILLEQGVIFAVANIRGGGEYGDQWHRQGNLTNKQNVFDDFAAAALHLIERKYTTTGRLAITGGSNGGLLMGAMITQHPHMMKCVVSHVGIYDMLRVELHPNGAFNVPEFGTVKDKAQFEALFAYSPYHNIKAGTQYPATLFLTGANDPRVDPMHSRKMAAALQAANAADTPILLRTSMDSGHGAGTPLDEQIAQAVDVNAFFFAQLGVTYTPVKN